MVRLITLQGWIRERREGEGKGSTRMDGASESLVERPSERLKLGELTDDVV